tara:strand:- start:899 stop:1762 length:864 start_codon:yes stop_codon:yes gene_type:complete
VKKYQIKSFCKINLSLRVLKKLKTGYHRISSLITFCNLHDLISINIIKKKEDKIIFSGKFKKGINIKKNTLTNLLFIMRKKKLLKKNFFKINIKKNIPHGSGLGGGSANAANLLNFLNIKMNLRLSNKIINKIANQIGFDVEPLLKKQNTFFTGNKRELIRIQNSFNLNMLVVYPNIICSTKKIYQKNRSFTFSKVKTNFNTSSKKKLIKFLKNETNDLENAVIKTYPIVGKIINLIKSQKGCYFSRVTGSGSACIGIFNNMKSANNAKDLIKQKFPNFWIATSKTI